MTWLHPQLDVDGAPASRSSLALRIVRYPLVLMLIGFAMVVLFIAAFGAVGDYLPEGPVVHLVARVGVAVAALCGYALFVRYVEGAPLTDFATYRAPRELAAGLALGGGLFALITGVVALFGGYRIIGHNSLLTLLPMLGIAVQSGVCEEILFRGILFRFVEKAAGSYAALGVTAFLFGAAHLMNPNATMLAAFAIAIEAGILLGALYMLTRRLWAAIGFHAAWNFTQGFVFGIPISGISEAGLVRSVRPGPEWLTGGAFGLEASVVAMLLSTAMGLALFALARRRGQVRRREGAEAASAPKPEL